MRIFLPCIAVALAWGGSARAGNLSISIQEAGYAATTLATGSGGTIDVPSGVVAGAPDFSFSGFNVTSILGATEGTLAGSGTIDSLNQNPKTLTVLISDNGYTLPAGPNYTMASSSSYSFGFPNSTTDSFSFQSFANPGSVLFAMADPSPGHTYSPLIGFGSDHFDEAPTAFSSGTGYTLTESYVWNSTAANDTFQATGSTIVTGAAVPEPASVVLLGLGSLGLVVIHCRRRVF